MENLPAILYFIVTPSSCLDRWHEAHSRDNFAQAVIQHNVSSLHGKCPLADPRGGIICASSAPAAGSSARAASPPRRDHLRKQRPLRAAAAAAAATAAAARRRRCYRGVAVNGNTAAAADAWITRAGYIRGPA